MNANRTALTATLPSQTKFFVPLILLGCVCIPIILSQLFFAHQSLRLDEAQSLWQTSRSLENILYTVASDVHVPLYHLLLNVWRSANISLNGDSVEAARMLSLIFYLLAIPALYALARTAYNERTSVFAAFLFALSPFMNWYGNEIRMYTLFVLIAIIHQYCFIRILQKRGTDHVWSWFILSTIAGIYTHYFFLLLLGGEVLYTLVNYQSFSRSTLFRLGGTLIAALLLFAPWVWYVMHVGTIGFQEPALARPSSVDFFNMFTQFLFGFQNDALNTVLLSLWPVTVVLGLLALRRNVAPQPETEYFLMTIFAGLGAAFIGSFLIAPMFLSRYLIFTTPALYMATSSLITGYQRRFSTTAQWSLITLMAGMLIIEIGNPAMPLIENYGPAAAYLEEHATAQDVVVLSAPFTVYPIQYYYRGEAPITTLPKWNQYAHGPIPAFSEDSLPQDIQKATNGSQNAYVLLSYNQGYERSIKDYFDSHYQRLAAISFSHDLTLYEYRLRYDTGLSAISP